MLHLKPLESSQKGDKKTLQSYSKKTRQNFQQKNFSMLKSFSDKISLQDNSHFVSEKKERQHGDNCRETRDNATEKIFKFSSSISLRT